MDRGSLWMMAVSLNHGLSPQKRDTVTALVREWLADDADLSLQIASGSMTPLLEQGDWVRIKPSKAAVLQRGDIVCYQSDGGFVVHRLLFRRGQGQNVRLVTKGDTCSEVDEAWTTDRLIGLVASVDKGQKTFDFENRRWRMVNRFLGLLGACQCLLFDWVHSVEKLVNPNGEGAWGKALFRALRFPGRLCLRWAVHVL